MSKKGSDAPAAPDPAATAQAQAKANRVSQFTPDGNLIWGTIGANGQFVPSLGKDQAASVIEQTPFQKEFQGISQGSAIDLAKALAPNAGSLQSIDLAGLPDFVSNIDFSQFQPLPTADQFSADRDKMEKATYDRLVNLMTPQFDQQQRRLEGSLADRGLPISGEAYNGENGAMTNFYRSKNSALEDAALQAVNAGASEQQRLLGNAMTTRGAQISDALTNVGLASNARGQTLGEQSNIRAQQLQELAALLGGSYNPSGAAAFTPGGQIDVVGPSNAAYQGALANYQNQQNNNAATMQGLTSAAVAALPLIMSDREMKENIEPVSDDNLIDSMADMPIYAWNYKEGPDRDRHVGPMAQDWQKATGLGDGKTISPVDAVGTVVRLAKIMAQDHRERMRA